MVPSGRKTNGVGTRPSITAWMLRARCRASRTVCCASAGYGRPSGPGIAAQSPSAHTFAWLRLRIVPSTAIRPRWSCTTGIAVATALGTMPAASTIVPASMISFATRTRPASIARTGVETRMSAPRRWSTRAATAASFSSISGRMRGTGLEQQEANLVASESRIEAQHVIRECRELAQQLDTDEAAADHDDREAAATHGRLRGRVGSLELLDQVIPQHQRVRHRLERERVR